MVQARPVPAHAERIENQVAVFSALDKVTARISKVEVELNKTATFGGSQGDAARLLFPPATEEPKTTTFVEVDEVQLDGKGSAFSPAGCLRKARVSTASSIRPSTSG